MVMKYSIEKNKTLIYSLRCGLGSYSVPQSVPIPYNACLPITQEGVWRYDINNNISVCKPRYRYNSTTKICKSFCYAGFIYSKNASRCVEDPYFINTKLCNNDWTTYCQIIYTADDNSINLKEYSLICNNSKCVGSDNRCSRNCPTDCNFCIQYSVCLSCNNGSFLYSSSCISNCSTTLNPYYDQTNNLC